MYQKTDKMNFVKKLRCFTLPLRLNFYSSVNNHKKHINSLKTILQNIKSYEFYLCNDKSNDGFHSVAALLNTKCWNNLWLPQHEKAIQRYLYV